MKQMQRLLGSAVWDADLVRNDLRTYILERLGDPHAILVIDETALIPYIGYNAHSRTGR